MIPKLCSCIFCRKLTSNLGLASHVRIVHLGDKSFQESGQAATRGRPAHNKGKSSSEETKKKIAKSLVGKTHSEERRSKTSEAQKRSGKCGGFRVGGGRGKKGKYRGIHCDSSWELAFLIWAFDNHKNITRVKCYRLYEFEGQIRRYYPDFEIDGKIFEIKGWLTPQSSAKQASNPDVTIIGKNEIQVYIDYAKLKYGEDFLSAYDTKGSFE